MLQEFTKSFKIKIMRISVIYLFIASFLYSCNTPFHEQYKIKQEIYYYGLKCENANINTIVWKDGDIMASEYDKEIQNVDSVAALRINQANNLIACDSIIGLRLAE